MTATIVHEINVSSDETEDWDAFEAWCGAQPQPTPEEEAAIAALVHRDTEQWAMAKGGVYVVV